MSPDGKRLIHTSFIDTTEEKQILQQLKSERDRYDRLFKMSYNMAVCGIIQTDVQNKRVININKEALRLLGDDGTALEKKIFEGQGVKLDSEGMNLAGIGRLLQSIKEKGHKSFKSVLYLNNDRHISIEGSADWVMEDNTSKVIQFTFLDTTERELLREAEVKLEIATKASEAKSYFLSKMSHEIRTPMNGIVGMIDSAMLYIQNEEKLKDCLKKMKRSSEHLQQIVDDVLDMSKIESGKMDLDIHKFNLKQLLSDVVYNFEYLAKRKGIGLSQARNYSHTYVVSDAVKLREILENLINNAIKFTEAAGWVVVIVEEKKVAEDKSAFTFRVKDSGKGISEADQELIFDVFEQGSSRSLYGNSGSGLGLAICKRLVDMLGGSLSVRSVEGQGSEFFFTLTLEVVDQGTEEDTIPKAKEGANYQGLRVMVAEDNELNGEIAETFLREYGFDVELTVNGKEAADRFEKEPEGTYCLILMDIQMPVMNGYEAAQRIRQCGKGDAQTVPILAMSANAFKEDIEKSLQAGMNGHLAKPMDMKKLIKEIEKYIPCFTGKAESAGAEMD